MNYRIWQHIDSGIELEVDADSEEEALEKAKLQLNDKNPDYDDQILGNAQASNPEVVGWS